MKNKDLPAVRFALRALFALSVFTAASCSVDYLGFFNTTDVDTRFADSRSLGDPADIPAGATNFSVIAISDLHVFHRRNSNLTRLLSYVRPSDKFLISCGDNVQDGQAEDFQALTNYFAAFGMSCFTAPGNHDIYFGGWTNYLRYCGSGSYTFAAGGARFVCLDSASGTLGGPQRKWLSTTLSNAAEGVIVVFTHFEFFSTHLSDLQEYTDPEEIAYLMSQFEKYGVDLVLMGHSHSFDDRSLGGVRYMTLDDIVDGTGSKTVARLVIGATNVAVETFVLTP